MKDITINQDDIKQITVRQPITCIGCLFLYQGDDTILLTPEGARKLRKALNTWLKELDHG